MLKKIILFCTSGLSLVTILGFFGHLHWTLDLFAHFRFQYVWIGLILAFLLSLKKEWTWIGVALSCVLLNAAVIVHTFPLATQDSSDNVLVPDTTRIYFANTYFANRDAQQIAQSIEREQPDVVILAEIEPDTFAAVSQRLPDYAYTTHYDPDGLFDLGVLSRVSFSEPVIHNYADDRFPSIDISIDGPNQPLRIIGTHPIVPIPGNLWRNRNAHLNGLAQDIDQRPTLVIGDFNITPWSPVFRRFLQEGGLTRQPTDPTWPTFLPATGFRIPIDHVLTRDVKVFSAETGEDTGADHLPVIVDVLY
jgi:endonuclease/exonuclease/phosphatase (EEP) superfamily protein YafD